MYVLRSASRPRLASWAAWPPNLIAGMRDIRAFNRQEWSLERLQRLLRELRDARVYEGFVVGWTWVTTTLLLDRLCIDLLRAGGADLRRAR